MTLRTSLLCLLFNVVCACSGGETSDGGIDAAVDAGPDAYRYDSGRRDAGPRDSGVDALTCIAEDAAVCGVGLACSSSCACPIGLVCQPPVLVSAFTAPDCAGGFVDVPAYFAFQGGYCTNALITDPASHSGSPGACDPTRASDDPAIAGMDGCPSCSKCVAESTTSGTVQCRQRCTPSATDSGGCRPGYTCDLTSRVCREAYCRSDLDCRGDTASAGGCIDTTSTAGCDVVTGRCHHRGATGAVAGDMCVHDSDCETDGACLTELYRQFPGGYCTRLNCEILGCGSPDDACVDLGPDESFCLKPCTVDAETSTLVFGAGGHGDTCRPGYQCLYDDHSGVGATGNGGCWIGNYNAIVANNVGHACSDDSTCYSPHGAGKCDFANAAMSCSISGCAGYPASENICGTGNSCRMFDDGSSGCFVDCATDTECAGAGAPPSYRCLPVFPTGGSVCWPTCVTDVDCPRPFHCTVITIPDAGIAFGTCG